MESDTLFSPLFFKLFVMSIFEAYDGEFNSLSRDISKNISELKDYSGGNDQRTSQMIGQIERLISQVIHLARCLLWFTLGGVVPLATAPPRRAVSHRSGINYTTFITYWVQGAI